MTNEQEKAKQALELMKHIKGRPCEVCEFQDEEGCHKWDCVFDEWLHAYVYGGEPNDK